MPAAAKTGWERERRTHFDEVVENYDRIRPGYPGELFEDVLEYSENKHSEHKSFEHNSSECKYPGAEKKKALEIGAGTGKATAPFLNAGYDVTAVEIGANMVAFLLEKFKENQHFHVIQSAFEDASLEENCYDLIYAASAFHWVDAEIGCPKAFRLLKSGGVFALFRYNALPAYGEPLYREIQVAYEKHYYSHYQTNERPVNKSSEEYWKPSELFRAFRFEDMGKSGFQDIFMKLYDGAITYSTDEYIMFLDTMSDHRSLPEGNRAALFAGVKEAIERHGGQHQMAYAFQLYMGRKP